MFLTVEDIHGVVTSSPWLTESVQQETEPRKAVKHINSENKIFVSF